VSDAPGLPADAGEQRELLARLRGVVEARDTEITVLRAELGAEREPRQRDWHDGNHPGYAPGGRKDVRQLR
jgi:hypothetical protein